jgi:hypothetical protein
MNAQNENVALTMVAEAELEAKPFNDQDFDEELFAHDSVFTKAFQANLRRMATDMDAGKNVVYRDIIETKP